MKPGEPNNPPTNTDQNERDNRFAAELLRRLEDYRRVDITEARKRLVEAWRHFHPEAAAQPASEVHHPLVMHHRRQAGELADAPDEIWHNDIYLVTVRRGLKDQMFKSDEGITALGISAHDGTARHDWREFQGIKNQLVGEEVEGFELYPADSRLMDPSNYYTIWCFPGVKRLRVGATDSRRVLDADEALAPQRGLPKL